MSPYSKTPRRRIRPHRLVQGRLIIGSDFAIDNCWQRLVIHPDQFGSVFGDGRSFSDHRGNRLTLIACAINGHWVVEDPIAGRRTDLEKGSMSFEISGPVKVQTTPGSAAASETSMPVILACA